jgi:hypothetical protein
MAANRIEGTSGNAIQIVGFDSTLTASFNRAVGNDISQLSASDADVLFGPDTTNNLFAGHCNTYIDLGIGNRILCGIAIGPAASATATAVRPGPVMDALREDVRRARLDAIRARSAQ